MSDIIGQVFIETSLESYQSIIDDEWVETIIDSVSKSSSLKPLLLDMLTSWRAASYTVQFPRLLVELTAGWHRGYSKATNSNTVLLDTIGLICKDLGKTVPELQANSKLRETIHTEMVKSAARVRDIRSAIGSEFPVQKLWDEYIRQEAVFMGIAGSQITSYVMLYNSYEAFLIHCLKHATGKASIRVTRKNEFEQCVSDILGADAIEHVWREHHIEIGRLARHALSHAGGRVTDDLKKYEAEFTVLDNRIQITPTNLRALISALRKGTVMIVKRALMHPMFKAT